MLVFAIALFTASLSYLVMASMPKPRLPKAPPPRAPLPEPEPEYDPSAFWLFPDWDSGPIDEPFWMRPLKVPVIRDRAAEVYNGNVMFGTTFVPGNVIYYGEMKEKKRPNCPKCRRSHPQLHVGRHHQKFFRCNGCMNDWTEEPELVETTHFKTKDGMRVREFARPNR